MLPTIAGLVLAAGSGRRYGMPKALIPYGDRLLVQRAADTLRQAGVGRTVVVLGARAGRVLAAAADLPEPVLNPHWEEGVGSSLRAGLAALAGADADAAVILLADMPGVTAEAVRRVAARADPEALAIGSYGERRGHPVLLGRRHWAGAAAMAQGDRGARDYLRAHAAQLRTVPIGDIADDHDIDTPEAGVPHHGARRWGVDATKAGRHA